MQDSTSDDLLVSPENAKEAINIEIKQGKDALRRIPSGGRQLGPFLKCAINWHGRSSKTLKKVFEDFQFVRDYELQGHLSIDYNKSLADRLDDLRSYYQKNLKYLEKALTRIDEVQKQHWWERNSIINAALKKFYDDPLKYVFMILMGVIALATFLFVHFACDKETNTVGPPQVPGNEAIVDFPDPQLALQIREVISKPYGDIYKDDLLHVTELNLTESSIVNIWGLENCVNLQSLVLDGRELTDITPLGNLTKLTDLPLFLGQISDVSTLQYLTELRQLALIGPEITDINFLRPLVKLEVLGLPGKIQNISPLRVLTHLTSLSIGVMTSDISPLQNLTELKSLSLTGSEISDINAIGYLTEIEDLTIFGSQLHDLQPIKNLTNLWHLRFDHCFNVDLESIQGLPNLTHLDIRDSQLEDISALRDLPGLTELHLDHNLITNIEPIGNLVSLEILWLQNNEIQDISPLEHLVNINELHLRNNHIEDLAPLVRNQGLSAGDLLSLTGNPLNSISVDIYKPELQARGVHIQ